MKKSGLLVALFLALNAQAANVEQMFECESRSFEVTVIGNTDGGILTAHDWDGTILSQVQDLKVVRLVQDGKQVVEFINNGSYEDLPEVIFRMTFTGEDTMTAISYDDLSDGKTNYDCVLLKS